jgi:hypothetical protein
MDVDVVVPRGRRRRRRCRLRRRRLPLPRRSVERGLAGQWAARPVVDLSRRRRLVAVTRCRQLLHTCMVALRRLRRYVAAGASCSLKAEVWRDRRRSDVTTRDTDTCWIRMLHVCSRCTAPPRWTVAVATCAVPATVSRS